MVAVPPTCAWQGFVYVKEVLLRRIKSKRLLIGSLCLALSGCAGTPLSELEIDAENQEASIRVLEQAGFSCWRQPTFVSCSRKRGNPFCGDSDHVMFQNRPGQPPSASKSTVQRTCRK